MWVLDLGIIVVGVNSRRDCRCEATFERIEPFFALAANPVRSLDVAVLGAKTDV